MTERVLVTGGSGFIGSHLVEEIAKRNCDLINLDLNPPSVTDQAKYWRRCDIKDYDALNAAFQDFLPIRVIHLAAKANLSGQTVDDFPDNTIGTANVVECVNRTDSVKLLLNTSTQYVVTPGICPNDDTYLEPYTAYGESKAAAERIVRENCKRCWSTIRPTNIWGPQHAFFPYELWRYLELGYYVHPGFRPIYKHYGYVSNAVAQILLIALSKRLEEVAGRVWYITDGAIDNAQWMNGFSLGLRGKPVRRVPLQVWRIMARVGDLLSSAGFKFPVNSDRLFRLTVTESLPESKIVKLPNEVAITLQEGIERCITWYRSSQDERARSGK
jgi:nucleoside-diphosphate-sugar epimerase